MKTLARARDREEIGRRLGRLRPDSARRWGRMSAHQTVCHMSDALRMGMGHKPVTPAATLWRRTLLKWFALYAPLRWPAGVPTSPELDQERDACTRPAQFAADVRELERLLAQVTTRPRPFAWQDHPIFGRMSEAAWLRWGYLHADHHLRQFGV